MKTPALRISRRRFLGGVFFLAAGSAGYTHWIEPQWLQTSRHVVPLFGGAQRPVKLLHLSDLHASNVVSLRYLSRAVDASLALRPDLICVTGDFVTASYEAASAYAAILRRLSSAAPCYASLGNHDGGIWSSDNGGFPDVTWVTALLRDSQLPLLENRATTVSVNGSPLRIVGLGDAWARRFDAAAAFAGSAGAQPTIVLSHNPDTKTELAPYRWELMLSGHTHGGQLRLPVIGTPFAPVQDKRFVAGLYRWNERWLHITKGVGNVLGMRFNCPPEISLLALT